MKKNVLLLVLFLFVTCYGLYAQSNNDKAEYLAKGIDVVLQNDQGEELAKVPFGEAVSISFDHLSKMIEIKFQNKNGGMDAMTLFSLSESDADGIQSLKMKDNLGNHYSVIGNIEKYGSFIIVFDAKTKAGNTTMLTIQGAKRV